MTKFKQNLHFALTVTLSAILLSALLLTAFLSRNFAYGSEISLPWDIEATVEYNGDRYVYRLADNVDGANKSTVYIGKSAKFALYEELTAMQLPDEAVYEYILPGFGKLIRHFSYLDRNRADATIDFDGKFVYRSGTDGRTVDRQKLFVALLSLTARKGIVQLPLAYDRAVTVDDLKQVTVVKGKFTTTFYASGENRCYNIARCCAALDGTTIDVGETFSFNEIVGPRTEQNGYKNAVVINQGKYVEGVGGGVCQVSTTLYNALLLANFVPSAHKHTLACSYVEPGFDAMVAYGTSDLTFINDTDYPIYISAKVVGKTVTMTVYGVTNAYTVIRESEHTRTPFDILYVVDETLSDGEEKVLCNGSDGIVSKAYLCYYDGDKLIERRLIRTDVYKKVDKVIARNGNTSAQD